MGLSLCFLLERDIKETIPFTSTTKRIKYLWIHLPKETEDLYAENYKTLMKEIKDDMNRWRDIPCSWTERINTVKWLYYPKQSTGSVQFPIKLSMAFFTELLIEQKKSHNLYGNTKIPSSQSNFEKEGGAGGINLSDFRLYYKATDIKTVWYWHKDRNIDQWNKTESPEINPCTYGHFIFDKGGKNT